MVATIGSNRNEGERSEPEIVAVSLKREWAGAHKGERSEPEFFAVSWKREWAGAHEGERSEPEFAAANPPPRSRCLVLSAAALPRRRWLFFDGAV